MNWKKKFEGEKLEQEQTTHHGSQIKLLLIVYHRIELPSLLNSIARLLVAESSHRRSSPNQAAACRSINSCRRDPEGLLFRDSVGGMILNMFAGEINGYECDDRCSGVT